MSRDNFMEFKSENKLNQRKRKEDKNKLKQKKGGQK